jgi:AraC family transcriptional regulator
MAGGLRAVQAAVAMGAAAAHLTPTSGRHMLDADEASMCRTRLMENGIGLVESLRIAGPATPRARAESYSPDFQVCLPYAGAFVWHVGQDEVVADANRVLFVAGGEGFRLSQPLHGGYAELIITIQPCLLADMLGVPERQLRGHALFRHRSRPAGLRLQRLGVECLHRSSRDGWGGLAGEEWLLDFLRASFAAPMPTLEASPSTTRLLGRAKQYLSANLSAPVRLAHVARAVGASPAYLTTVFRRLEGLPLHRYLVQLRLARALVELPHTSDLTGLACELGFSNHSHFTAAFVRALGCTPSQFRESMRRDRLDISARRRQAHQPVRRVVARIT